MSPHQSELGPGSFRLARVAGVPIGIHYSWFFIAAMIVFWLQRHFQATNPAWGSATVWLTAVVTGLLYFGAVLAHELSHALMAMAHGLPVRSITLFALGGLARIGGEAATARTEFLVAVVGPLTSYGIGIVCLSIAWSLGWSFDDGSGSVAAAMIGWLGTINVILATFNLIPGYPLDGGRVLRAALWWSYGDSARATRTAARVGQVVAGLFITAGLLQFFIGMNFGGLWLAFIGWFLMVAAQATYAQARLGDALRDVRVADVMASDCAAVDADTTVQSLVDDLLLRTGRGCVVVKRDDRLVGLITPDEVRTIARAEWTSMRAREIMRPFERTETVTPGTSLSDAFTTMTREEVNQLPVVAEGRLQGIVSRGQIMRLIQARSELGG
jgi:Zn-dependent protease/CBS domain-containing protein